MKHGATWLIALAAWGCGQDVLTVPELDVTMTIRLEHHGQVSHLVGTMTNDGDAYIVLQQTPFGCQATMERRVGNRWEEAETASQSCLNTDSSLFPGHTLTFSLAAPGTAGEYRMALTVQWAESPEGARRTVIVRTPSLVVTEADV